MANEILKRDENHVTVSAAVTNDANQEVTMLRVDPATKYLLVEIIASTSTPGTSGQIAKRDGNHVPVCLGWDETNGVLQEILTDDQGNLLCDLLIV